MAKKFGIPPAQRDPLAYADVGLARVPTVDAPRAPTTLDDRFPTQTIWRQTDPNDLNFFCEFILVGFNVNGAIWVKFANSTISSSIVPEVQGAYDLMLAYDIGTGVATIQGANNIALSISNPGFLVLPSNVTGDEGKLVTYTLESNFTFEDANGTSDFAGSLFGFDTGDTSTVTSDRSIVFFLYAAAENETGTVDTNPTFFVSRLPSWPKLTTGDVHNTGDADEDGSLQALTPVTLANFEESKAVMIGQIDMAINGSDDWTINAGALGITLGINFFQGFCGINWSQGVYGAATDSFFLDNGGTAPTTPPNRYVTQIDVLNGLVTCNIDLTLGGTPSGAVDAKMTLPITGQNFDEIVSSGYFYDGGDSGNVSPILFERDTTTRETARTVFLLKADGTTGRWQYNEMSSGDVIKATINYRIV